MKRLFLIPLAVLSILGLTALSYKPIVATREMVTGTAGSTTGPLLVTTTSNSYFIPAGYVRLSCTTPTYYSVNASSATAATTSSSVVPGPVTVNGVEVQRPLWLNVSSGTQYLALLVRSGVNGYCVVEQVSADGTAPSFSSITSTGATTTSTLAVSSTSTFGDIITTGSAIDAGSLNVVGQTTMAGSLNLASSTAVAGIKWGTITLGGQSPATGTATVLSGMQCYCTPVTNAADGATKCAVSSTTLTATGPNTSTGVINYLCVK